MWNWIRKKEIIWKDQWEIIQSPETNQHKRRKVSEERTDDLMSGAGKTGYPHEKKSS